MTIEITEELRQALATPSNQPLRLVDRKTNATYVVLRAEDYEILLEDLQDKAEQKAWLESSTKARRAWVRENPY